MSGALLVGALGAAPALGWTNYELGAQPQGVPGQTCPTASAAESNCSNFAAEPQIRADNSGNFYGASENGLGGGTDAWRSTAAQDAASFTYLGEPDAGSTAIAQTGFAPGGGDTDVAVAPAKNSAGMYNVYVASLSLANVDVSTSTDGGNTFTLNPLAATIPGDDREWIAADGPSKVCVSYHDLATDNVDVNCSADAGSTFTQLGEAIDPSHEYLAQDNEIGNLAIDPSSHDVYQVMNGVANATEAVEGANYHVVYLAVSTDGGKTFTDHTVYAGPASASYDHNFTNVSVDRAGNVYVVWSDNHVVQYSYSSDHGASWNGPYTISQAPSDTAIYPWSTAGDDGHLAVVYYGTSYYDGSTPPDSYPATAQWYAYYAENDNVLGDPSGFTEQAATPVVHTGAVCEGGISCTGNRDLYDDFGVAVSPVSDTAAIIYSDDQYGGTNSPPYTGCDPSTNDSASCDHTSIAVGSSQLFSTAATTTSTTTSGHKGQGRTPKRATGRSRTRGRGVAHRRARRPSAANRIKR